MKRTIILTIFATLALGVLLGFALDRFIIEEALNESTPTPESLQENTTDAVDQNITVSENLDFCSGIKSRIPGSDDFVITTTIASGELIIDGGEISGCVYSINDSYGGWAPFEGQVGSYSIVGSDGILIAEGPLSVTDQNWMDAALAGESIEYRQVLSFDPGSYAFGEIILENENASGEASLDKAIIIPVSF